MIFTLKQATNKAIVSVIPFLCGLALIIALWQAGSLIVNSEIILPSPLSVLKMLVTLVPTSDFLEALAATSLRLLSGLLISIPLGIAAGLAAGLNKVMRSFFRPIFTLIAATPVMSVILIAFLAFGSEKTPVFTVFLMVFPVMAANTVEGIHAIDPKFIELFDVYGLNRRQRLSKLYLPFILPFLAGGIRASLSLGWKVIVAAEVLVQPFSALGSEMQIAKANLRTTELFALTCATVIAAALTELLLNLIPAVNGRKNQTL
ncbi:MAG: ABC transporter permease subunit [Spirochaetaceae bacterium]|jgi:NitT/TauT family transport system permease protein|nr:ABC transporter permease subunit [Spirochaetaceae bacterium]